MFVLKIATTVWLALIALGMTSATLNEKETVTTRLIICGSSWDYDGWIKELQSEAE